MEGDARKVANGNAEINIDAFCDVVGIPQIKSGFEHHEFELKLTLRTYLASSMARQDHRNSNICCLLFTGNINAIFRFLNSDAIDPTHRQF